MQLKIIDTRTGETVNPLQYIYPGSNPKSLKYAHFGVLDDGDIVAVCDTGSGATRMRCLYSLEPELIAEIVPDLPPLRDRWGAVLAPIKPVLNGWGSVRRREVEGIIEALINLGEAYSPVATDSGFEGHKPVTQYVSLYFAKPGVKLQMSVEYYKGGESDYWNNCLYAPSRRLQVLMADEVAVAVRALLCPEAEYERRHHNRQQNRGYDGNRKADPRARRCPIAVRRG
jgi:hypothetical protein